MPFLASFFFEFLCAHWFHISMSLWYKAHFTDYRRIYSWIVNIGGYVVNTAPPHRPCSFGLNSFSDLIKHNAIFKRGGGW